MLTVASDMDAVSRVDSYFNNMRLPWEKKDPAKSKDLMFSVGVCDLFSLKKNYLNPTKLSGIRYGMQAIVIKYSPDRDIFLVGLDDGKLFGYQLQRTKHPFYKNYLELKVHEKRLMDIHFNPKEGKVYTIGEDGFLRVIDFVKKKVIASKVSNLNWFVLKIIILRLTRLLSVFG
jgi:WD40 repeat protein